MSTFKTVGGIHGGRVFFAVGNWFKFLGGAPGPKDYYVEIFGQVISSVSETDHE